MVELIQTGNTLNYYQNYPLQYTGTTSISAYTNPDLTLQNFTKFVWGAEFSAATKLAYYTTTGASGSTTPTNYTGVGSSEILVFELYGGGCDDDQLHFYFLILIVLLERLPIKKETSEPLTTKRISMLNHR